MIRDQLLKNERVSIRVSDEFKKKLEILAEKDNKTLSQFIYDYLKERIENEGLTDSQGQFLKLFDIAFSKSYAPYHKKEMLVLNKNNFNSEWSLEVMDLFMKHLKIPQTRDEVKTSFTNHPITDIAHDKVLKELRSQSVNKKEREDEFE